MYIKRTFFIYESDIVPHSSPVLLFHFPFFHTSSSIEIEIEKEKEIEIEREIEKEIEKEIERERERGREREGERKKGKKDRRGVLRAGRILPQSSFFIFPFFILPHPSTPPRPRQ